MCSVLLQLPAAQAPMISAFHICITPWYMGSQACLHCFHVQYQSPTLLLRSAPLTTTNNQFGYWSVWDGPWQAGRLLIHHLSQSLSSYNPKLVWRKKNIISTFVKPFPMLWSRCVALLTDQSCHTQWYQLGLYLPVKNRAPIVRASYPTIHFEFYLLSKSVLRQWHCIWP